MRYEIRKSEQGFYYLLKIDAQNNEEVLAQSNDLKELKAHSEIKGTDVKVVNEVDTRGTIPAPKPPKQPKRK